MEDRILATSSRCPVVILILIPFPSTSIPGYCVTMTILELKVDRRLGVRLLFSFSSLFPSTSIPGYLALNLATEPSGWYLTLNTHFDPIAFRPGGSSSYSHVWWFSKFCNSSSMASRQRRPWIGSLTAALYNVGSWILLLDSVIDIATSSTSLRWSSTGVVISIAICFCGLFLGLGSPAGAFFFDLVAVSKGHLLSSLAPCSGSSMYGSLAMTTCLVCGAQTRKCFIVSGLYPMRMPCQTLWWSDFDLFSSEMLHKARLPNMRTCWRSYRLVVQASSGIISPWLLVLVESLFWR